MIARESGQRHYPEGPALGCHGLAVSIISMSPATRDSAVLALCKVIARFPAYLKVFPGTYLHVEWLKMFAFQSRTWRAIEHVHPCTASLASPLNALSHSSSPTFKSCTNSMCCLCLNSSYSSSSSSGAVRRRCRPDVEAGVTQKRKCGLCIDMLREREKFITELGEGRKRQ